MLMTDFQRNAIIYCSNHGTHAEPGPDGSVIVHVGWYIPGTDEHGFDREQCFSASDVRASLGY